MSCARAAEKGQKKEQQQQQRQGGSNRGSSRGSSSASPRLRSVGSGGGVAWRRWRVVWASVGVDVGGCRSEGCVWIVGSSMNDRSGINMQVVVRCGFGIMGCVSTVRMHDQ